MLRISKLGSFIMQKGVDYIGVGVGAAIIKDSKLFITKRGEKAKNERGKWEIPGGSVEFGETFSISLKRELKEENDIEIEPVELLGICDHIIPDEHQHWVSPTYICRLISGEPKILEPNKCAEIGWFNVAEAEELPLSIVTKYDISLLKKKFPNGLPKW
jgi:mutator protein MutT